MTAYTPTKTIYRNFEVEAPADEFYNMLAIKEAINAVQDEVQHETRGIGVIEPSKLSWITRNVPGGVIRYWVISFVIHGIPVEYP